MSAEALSIAGLEESFHYDMTQIIRLFFETDDFRFFSDPASAEGLVLHFTGEGSGTRSCSLIRGGEVLWSGDESFGAHTAESPDARNRELKRLCLRLGWKALSAFTGTRPPWGILVGVRPTKVAHELLAAGLSVPEALKRLEERFCMAPDKGSLILAVAQKEARFIQPHDPTGYSLYFGVPFCPSRCSYCSFPAFTGPAKTRLIPEYVRAMIAESEAVSGALRDRWADSVYIGGGTPTMLSAEQLDALLGHIAEAYDLSRCREITVEAGRPDTITPDKLAVLKAHGVDRICLNPQSFSEATLRRVGRSHGISGVHEALAMIRSTGFKTLNMDIILGLPGETPEDVTNTLKAVAAAAPENLTVHTLAMKRGSELRQLEQRPPTVETMETMLRLSAESAARMGLEPYYMYRQKFMLANLENVGYARPGHESIYNMQIMEEKQDILSFGTGGVSKICFPSENRHERVPNVRGLEEYLARQGEMARRKLDMLEEKRVR